MAIKERKQITGTEARIKGYAGHKGVLAYATDTKHLHVLSGTAGTTTELANRTDIPDITGKADTTYVNAELTKKQNKGDYATTSALTSGLAGKADKAHTHAVGDVTGLQSALDGKQPKGSYATTTALTTALNKKENAGVCLPLTGGTMLGNIFFKPSNGEFSIGNLATGARFSLNEATRENFEGKVVLQASDGTKHTDCVLAPNGDLTVNSKVVERVDGLYTTQFTGGYCDVLRYVTGLQIVTAAFIIPADKVEATLTFTRPFINNTYSITANIQATRYDVDITWASPTATSVTFNRRVSEGKYNFATYITCVFIGRWL